MKISRLAIDLNEFLEHAGITRASFIGHSMGCSVLWSYIELCGEASVERLVLIDQPPMMLCDPAWSERERLDAGAFVTNATLYANAVCSPSPVNLYGPLRYPMNLGSPAFRALEQPTGPANTEALSRLMLNHATQDWRNLVPRVAAEKLIFSGEYSNWLDSQRWLCEHMQRAKLVVFTKNEMGTHDLCVENHLAFNTTVLHFLMHGQHDMDD